MIIYQRFQAAKSSSTLSYVNQWMQLQKSKGWIEVSNLSAGDPSIFKVGTVVITKWVTGTVHKSGLSSSTGYLVQKNGSSSPAKESTESGNCTCGAISFVCLIATHGQIPKSCIACCNTIDTSQLFRLDWLICMHMYSLIPRLLWVGPWERG